MYKSKNPYKPFICLEGLQCDEIGKAYGEGQLHPSPQTIKKIEDDFRNALKRAILKDVHKIETHDAGEYFDGGQLFRVISTLNTLKEKGDD